MHFKSTREILMSEPVSARLLQSLKWMPTLNELTIQSTFKMNH